MTKPRKLAKVIEDIAVLMAQPMCEHRDFFILLNESLMTRGYSISADQLGARGTYLRVVACSGPLMDEYAVGVEDDR